jgi:AcrR family transcriptional regulator
MVKPAVTIDGGSGGTRRMILHAAARLFRERGFAETTTRDLGKAVGIRGPSLYYHFETKQDLLLGVCREGVTRLAEAIDELPAEGSVEERLSALILMHVTTVLRDRDLHAVGMIELRSLTGERRAAIVEARNAYERRVEKLIGAGQKQGTIRNDMSSHELMLFMLSMLNWTIFYDEPSGPMDAGQLAQRLSRLFLDGANSQLTPALAKQLVGSN